MNVRPAGREACSCASPYNSILERLTAMEAEILAVQATANSAMGVANAQAGAAASSASAAAASATAAGNAAISAASDASDALTQATAAAGSADDAADSASDALTALQTIEGTIASVLASDIGGKVDKLTTAGFYLYMHNGSTQGEVQPVVAPTAATIPIRDSDGRMQAADPASGATDKTLVTANWVSQTGDSAPNNLVHKTGAENRTSGLFTSFYMGYKLPSVMNASANGKWIRWLEIATYYSENNIIEMLGTNANNSTFYAVFGVAGAGGFSRVVKIIEAGPNIAGYKIAVLRNTSTNYHEIWVYAANANCAHIICGAKYGYGPRYTVINEEYSDLPATGYGTPFYVLGSA